MSETGYALYVARLRLSLQSLLTKLEGYLSRVENGELPGEKGVGLVVLGNELSDDNIRPVFDCLWHLGLLGDARGLVGDLQFLGRYAIGPKFNEILARIAAADPQKADFLRKELGEFPSIDEVEATREQRDARDRMALDILRQAVTHGQQILAALPGAEKPALFVRAGTQGAHSVKAKSKRSTQKGEARNKIIGKLTEHHQYAKGSLLNQEPMGVNELARKAGVSDSTASEFFKKHFHGHDMYRCKCRDRDVLINALKLLNNEFPPHMLYEKAPEGAGHVDEDE